MPHPSFSCPYCSTPLRIRNRNLIGKQLACPDCGEPILIASAGPREISLQKIQSKPHSGPAIKRTSENGEKSDRLSRWLNVLRSPVGISWLVAGLLAAMLLLATWPSGKPASQDQDHLNNANQDISSKRSLNQKLSENNGENNAVGKAKQAIAVESSNKVGDGVDRNNDFPPPVAAVKPDPIMEPVQKQTPESSPRKPPVVATIPPEPLDLKAALGQPILRFQQKNPAPLRELLTLMEEMAGVPIRFSATITGDKSTLLDQPVSLQLEKTTVGDILKALLKQIHLDYELGFNEILIISIRQESSEENP